MKTQILHLEPYDDINSARDKMGWGQTRRILLVWPKNEHIVNRKIDLILLQRHSKQMGAQMAFVTRDADIKLYARELGIPVFRSLDQAQTSRWRRRRSRRKGLSDQPWPRSTSELDIEQEDLVSYLEKLRENAHPLPPEWSKQPGVRFGIFALAVLAVLAIAAVLVPSAQIKLTPQTQNQVTLFTAEADLTIDNINLSGVVPARETRVIVEGRDAITTTGSILLPDEAAIGSVHFINLTDQTVEIPAGTVVRTLDIDAVRFVILREGMLAPSPDGMIGLPIRALTRGEAGNLSAGEIQAVEGPLGLRVAVDNSFPTSGGADFNSPAPSPSDRVELRRKLYASLRETAFAEIQSQIGPQDILLDRSPKLVEVLEESYTPANTEPADRISMLMRVEFKASIVSGEDLEELIQGLLNASLPPGFTVTSQDLTIEQLTEPQWIGETVVRWQIRANREISANLSSNQAINLTMGLPPSEASARLSSAMQLDAPPIISLTPSWWPRLPILPFRIQITQSDMAGNSVTDVFTQSN
jgi:hypothetical protein